MRGIVIISGATALSALIGCVQYRAKCTPMVESADAAQVHAVHRYRIESIHARQNTNWEYLPSPIQVGKLRQVAQKMYPHMFADDGVPVRLHGNVNLSVNEHAARLVLMLGMGIIPAYISGDGVWNFEIEIGESSLTRATMQGRDRWAKTVAFLPHSWIVPMSESENLTSLRSFEVHEKTVGDVTVASKKTEELRYEAVAHGLAIKLKELENSGKAAAAIAYHRPDDPSMLEKRLQESMMAKPKPKSYTVVRCRRESAAQFMYSFAVKLHDDGQDALKSFRSVQKEFREEIKSDYLETFPDASATSLYVDFPEYGLADGMIAGRAEVLAITPVKCQYDATTRCGLLGVRFDQRQFEAARAWIRKNIEMLCRDKNIALTTGLLPPAATYYSLDEKVEGDVLEIKFKTE